MSEFEKWWDKFDCNIDIDCAGLSCDNCEVIRKETWIAALEYVMKMGMDNYGNDFLSMDLSKDIRKELEQLKNE